MRTQNLILVHWHDAEWEALAESLGTAGWTVVPLAGAAGLKLVDPPESRPAAVLISLRRLPSHGREVARAIWEARWARREIQLIFFDGRPEVVEQTRSIFPEAAFCRFEDLPDLLHGRMDPGVKSPAN